MSRWSSTIISFISRFFIFIDDNHEADDDDDDRENDDKNNYKQKFPCGRTLTLHYSLENKSKSKPKRERKEERKISRSIMYVWHEIFYSLTSVDWIIILAYRSHRSNYTFLLDWEASSFWHY
jgi:hypothetical protein